jgi:hypothetical protein
MKLFLGGAENITTHAVCAYIGQTVLSKGTDAKLLASYYSLQTNNMEEWTRIHRNIPASWIIDSGLFTMMFGAGKHKTYTEPDLTEYTKQYIGFMNNINYKHSLIEMDVHKVLGLQSLAKFRAMFEKQWDTERTIFVWHIEEGIEGLIKLANTYPYIALSIPELRIIARQHKKKLKTMVYSLFNIIEKNTKEYPKIHLLGCTQQELMKNNNYFSADSTSWLSPARFPHASVWANNTLIPCSQHNEQYKAFLNENAVAINNNLRFYAAKYHPKLKINEYPQKCAFGAYTLRQMENYINHRYKEGKHE